MLCVPFKRDSTTNRCLNIDLSFSFNFFYAFFSSVSITYSFLIMYAFLFLTEPRNCQGALLGLCEYACNANVCIYLSHNDHRLVAEARVSTTINVMSFLTGDITCHLF